jgi:hypothetical protein
MKTIAAALCICILLVIWDERDLLHQCRFRYINFEYNKRKNNVVFNDEYYYAIQA